MQWEMRHLRALVAVAEEGTFTDAAIRLRVSQAQVSRTVKALEQLWGVRLVRRLSREAVLTAEGRRAVEQGRHLLELAETIEAEASGLRSLRLGYAWSAAGRHTAALQRIWRQRHPEVELQLMRRGGPLAGLAEGLVDAAILRREPQSPRIQHVFIGSERRVAAFADDDPWADQDRISMADFAGRRLLVDTRAGTTHEELWPEHQRPERGGVVDSIDSWLDSITAGKGIGVSTEATAHQNRRDGVQYRLIADAASVGVYLAWHTGEGGPLTDSLRTILTALYTQQEGERRRSSLTL